MKLLSVQLQNYLGIFLEGDNTCHWWWWTYICLPLSRQLLYHAEQKWDLFHIPCKSMFVIIFQVLELLDQRCCSAVLQVVYAVVEFVRLSTTKSVEERKKRSIILFFFKWTTLWCDDAQSIGLPSNNAAFWSQVDSITEVLSLKGVIRKAESYRLGVLWQKSRFGWLVIFFNSSCF